MVHGEPRVGGKINIPPLPSKVERGGGGGVGSSCLQPPRAAPLYVHVIKGKCSGKGERKVGPPFLTAVPKKGPFVHHPSNILQ